MAYRWQVKKELSAGDFKVVDLPAGVGNIHVSLDYQGGGSGSCQYTYFNRTDAMANLGNVVWKDVFLNATAFAEGDIPDNATVVRFLAAGGPQIFHASGAGQ